MTKGICTLCDYIGYLKTKKLCKICYNKAIIEKKRNTKVVNSKKRGIDAIKVKQKKPARKSTTYCSKSTLASTVSKLTRTLFGYRCHGVCDSKKAYSYSELECAHFCGRAKQSTSYLLSNVLPTCLPCNRFTPEHVYRLGIEIDKKFGSGTAEKMLEMSRRNCKLSPKIRKQMNMYLRGIQARAEDIIRQHLTRTKELAKVLLALAIEANNELLTKYIAPNLI